MTARDGYPALTESDIASMSLLDCQEYIRERWLRCSGVDCPACGQCVKLYPRRLTSGMAYALIAMYRVDRRHPEEWIHVLDLLASLPPRADGKKSTSGDYAKMRYWGLIEENDEPAEADKSSNGLWRITERGREFVRGRSVELSHVWVFNKRQRDLSPPPRLQRQFDIHEALGKEFSYSELMAEQ